MTPWVPRGLSPPSLALSPSQLTFWVPFPYLIPLANCTACDHIPSLWWLSSGLLGNPSQGNVYLTSFQMALRHYFSRTEPGEYWWHSQQKHRSRRCGQEIQKSLKQSWVDRHSLCFSGISWNPVYLFWRPFAHMKKEMPNQNQTEPKPNQNPKQNLKQAKNNSRTEKLFHWNQLLLSMERAMRQPPGEMALSLHYAPAQ